MCLTSLLFFSLLKLNTIEINEPIKKCFQTETLYNTRAAFFQSRFSPIYHHFSNCAWQRG